MEFFSKLAKCTNDNLGEAEHNQGKDNNLLEILLALCRLNHKKMGCRLLGSLDIEKCTRNEW